MSLNKIKTNLHFQRLVSLLLFPVSAVPVYKMLWYLFFCGHHFAFSSYFLRLFNVGLSFGLLCHHLLLILSFFSLNLTFGLQPLASLLKKGIKMQYYFMKKYFREIWKWTFWKFDTLGKLLRKRLLFKSQSIYYQDYGTCLLYSLLKLLHKEANSLLCSIWHFSTLARLESLFFSKSVPGIYLLWDILSLCLITLASTHYIEH